MELGDWFIVAGHLLIQEVRITGLTVPKSMCIQVPVHCKSILGRCISHVDTKSKSSHKNIVDWNARSLGLYCVLSDMKMYAGIYIDTMMVQARTLYLMHGNHFSPEAS